jgi:hypothetical protein
MVRLIGFLISDQFPISEGMVDLSVYYSCREVPDPEEEESALFPGDEAELELAEAAVESCGCRFLSVCRWA